MDSRLHPPSLPDDVERMTASSSSPYFRPAAVCVMVLIGSSVMRAALPAMARALEAREVDVKLATKTAKEYVVDLFADEQIDHVGLEEVRFDQSSDVWEITIGFSRPWDRGPLKILPDPAQRSYKVVRINDTDGRVMSVVHRALTTAN